MDPALIDLYGNLCDISLHIAGEPVRVRLEFRLEDQRYRLSLDEPVELEPFLALFRDCWGIKVMDLNREQSAHLEFGRYRIEFWDEDNVISSTFATTVEIG